MKSTSCDTHRELIEELVAGELSHTHTAHLLEHLRRCGPCSELFELHARLSAWEGSEAEISDQELATVRRQVLDQLENQGSLRASTAWRFFPRQLPGPWRPALAATLALLLLGSGWWIGRRGSTGLGGDLVEHSRAADLGVVAAAYRPVAAGHDLQAEDLQELDLRNVRVRAIDQATVALSFDLATHVELRRSKDDPLVTEALVQSILGSSDLGDRLSAISQSTEDGDALSPRVRDALIQAMLADADLAVRQQAQSRLTQAMPDQAVENALLEVLEQEESVHMRLVAIDALASGGIGADRLRQAVEIGRPEPGNALKARASDYLEHQ